MGCVLRLGKASFHGIARILAFAAVVLLFWGCSEHAKQPSASFKVAVLADVHFHDVYGTFKDIGYNGIHAPGSKHKATIRTMGAQLHSTRLFNENYFAFLAALDQLVKDKITLVVLPGDFSDDGQRIHLRALNSIMEAYEQQYGMRFFLTTGNHDPVRPIKSIGGKKDFMGADGGEQLIWSDSISDPTALITDDIAPLGYAEVLEVLKQRGFYPQKRDLYWSTPFANYGYECYSFAKAEEASSLENRLYTAQNGFNLPDVSYVVEPVEGLWLLALDGDAYPPKEIASHNSQDPNNFEGASKGYANVLQYKPHLVSWIAKVVQEARKHHKVLLPFSHFPMVDFYDGQEEKIMDLLGDQALQMERLPSVEVSSTLAGTSMGIHFGGHMHMNDTGVFISDSGSTLVNVQSPSLAAYPSAYKEVIFKPDSMVEIRTKSLDTVPRFKELFPFYRMEHRFLQQNHPQAQWNDTILKIPDYRAYTLEHLKELIRLRFKYEWPQAFWEQLASMNFLELMWAVQLKDDAAMETFMAGREIPKDFLEAVHHKFGDLQTLKSWTGQDFITDFYLLRNGDELAKQDISAQRWQVYEKWFQTLPAERAEGFPERLRLMLQIMDGFMHGSPSDHFSVNLANGEVIDLKK